MSKCCIQWCSARKNRNRPQLTLHKVPSNEAMKRKWLDIIGMENINPNIKRPFVCSQHFENTCFNRTLNVIRLCDGAMPSPSLVIKGCTPAQITANLSPDASTSDAELDSNEDISSDDDDSVQPIKLTSLPVKTSRKRCSEKVLKSKGKECTERNAAESASSEQPTMACNECNKDIIGPRLVCVECCDVTICAACDGHGAHAHHYMLRVPANKPPEESIQLLKALRREFRHDDSINDEPLITADQIKEETLDPLENMKLEILIEPLDNIKEQSNPMSDIVEEEPEVELGKTSSIIEDYTVKVTPVVTSTLAKPTRMTKAITTIPGQPTMTSIVRTPAQATIVTPVAKPTHAQQTITSDPSFGVPMLVLHPLSVRQREPRASKRPTPSPPPTVGPNRPLTAGDTIAGRFEVFSHNSAASAKKRKYDSSKR